MKKKPLKIILILAAVIAAATAIFIFRGVFYAHSGVLTDSRGNTASWTLDWRGRLTVRSEGELSCGFSDEIAYGKVNAILPIDVNKHVRAVVVEDGTAVIGAYAFHTFTSVRRISLPDSITSIGERAFPPYAHLKNLYIPANVTDISPEAFVHCHHLREITVDEKNPSFASEDGVLFNKDKTELLYCPQDRSETTYTVPPHVTRIGDYAFSSCGRINRIDLPEGLKEIGTEAFYLCVALTEITLPEGVVETGPGAFSNCYQLTKAFLPDSVQLGDRLFTACEKLEEVRLPTGITVIPDSMFQMCENLTEFTVPASVTRIERHAFYDTGLRELTIPEGVTYIGTNAFVHCAELTSLTIPSSVTGLGLYPFGECELLKDIYFGGTPEQWQALLSTAEKGDHGVTADVTVHYEED